MLFNNYPQTIHKSKYKQYRNVNTGVWGGVMCGRASFVVAMCRSLCVVVVCHLLWFVVVVGHPSLWWGCVSWVVLVEVGCSHY
jgi:hypothetical protein